MSGEEVVEIKNEEEPEMTTNEKNEEEPNKEQKEEPKEEATTESTNTEPTGNDAVASLGQSRNDAVEEAKPKAKAKATPKKLARSVKVVELAECPDCLKKMLPKSLRNTHPHYCKGQPTETLPVNKQKASYGSKVEQKLRKEIEDEMRAKYEKEKENDKNAQNVKNEVVNYSEHEVACSSATLHEPIEVKTKASVPSVPVRMQDTPPPRQLTATELLQQHYNEIKKAKQQEKIEKINRFKSSMF